ncbi:hypothetical protein GCM10011519_23810 [Marmoricola endophyticus]|uniref:Uncharacterized protein n=1 Tax=Marmoricola endophyticus TaxID=2040280 RepID=A0A917BKA5_9ACTN|nr:hypothetical protein GCM10011519_23810 [Marmoricola endophyticus]
MLLVILAQVLTEAIRGTDNAGAAGIFLVIGIIALSVAVGAAVLRAWGQTETLSMSFLGVGLVVVVVMLFLLPVIFSWVMIPVVPVLGAGTFALSWWVSNRMGPEANRINDERWPETHR